MNKQVKLIIAEHLDKKKTEFLIYMDEKQLLGKGSFGEVRKAIQNDGSKELFAVKIIPYSDEEKRQKIEKEITIIRNLPRHTNLVNVQPIKCYSANNYYIFMEYCPGGTLEDERVRKKNNFSQEEIFNIFYQLMNGYRVLWNAKILHQDLKLENVLIKNSMYKLSDFGFSIFYQGFKHGNTREGTLPYMPIEKLTKKEYYATAKSDVYAMGVMFFELIAGHHPYLISVKKNDNREYIKQLRENELQLKPNFTNCFSIRFHHLFELILKMVAKEEEQRVNFDVIYEYIENQSIFDNLRKRVHQEETTRKSLNEKLIISNQSQAVAVNFQISETQQWKLKKEHEKEQKNELSEQQKKMVEEINNYIISNRILIYYFDRLTRRFYIEKMKKQCRVEEKQAIQKLIIGLMLLCRKIIYNMIKEYKNGGTFEKKWWKTYYRLNRDIITRIEKDDTYLEDFYIDCFLDEKFKIKITEKKMLIDQSASNLEEFKKTLANLLDFVLKQKTFIIEPKDNQKLITICYIDKGMEILNNYEKFVCNATELEKYFRMIQTDDLNKLNERVGDICQRNQILVGIWLE